jgi:hypothetical protein
MFETQKDLQDFINKSIDYKNSVLMYSEDTVLIKMIKGDNLEYVVFKYNQNGCYHGHYYSTKFDTQENAYQSAKSKFRDLII